MSGIIYPVIFLVAYLFGSFPSAYIILKLFTKKDIREHGSGNVGAVNALRTSKSKPLALIVLILDLAKGVLPTWYALYHMNLDTFAFYLLVTGLLIGHLFPVWLKFKGGRGLAVAAGALGVVNIYLVLIWLAVWSVFFIALRKHIIASMIATFILPMVVFFSRPKYFSDDILLYVLLICMLIFQRHLERVPDIVEEKRIHILNGAKK
jgi:glycerol-3-phosphate acyltransferase PlsY